LFFLTIGGAAVTAGYAIGRKVNFRPTISVIAEPRDFAATVASSPHSIVATSALTTDASPESVAALLRSVGLRSILRNGKSPVGMTPSHLDATTYLASLAVDLSLPSRFGKLELLEELLLRLTGEASTLANACFGRMQASGYFESRYPDHPLAPEASAAFLDMLTVLLGQSQLLSGGLEIPVALVPERDGNMSLRVVPGATNELDRYVAAAERVAAMDDALFALLLEAFAREWVQELSTAGYTDPVAALARRVPEAFRRREERPYPYEEFAAEISAAKIAHFQAIFRELYAQATWQQRDLILYLPNWQVEEMKKVVPPDLAP
jgi:hypothetical protein